MGEHRVSKKTFGISLEGEEYLTVDQIWPNGDAPDNPTIEDVEDVLSEYSPLDLVKDWNLRLDVTVF